MNCAGLDWEPVGVDFAGGQTRDANWRDRTNPMGEVPVLEVNGQLMSQSGAILVWLAETTGHFAPAADQRTRRCAGSCSTITSSPTIMRCIDSSVHSCRSRCIRPCWLSCARVEVSLAIVDKHLTDRPFMLGGAPTIVDFSLAGYVYYPAEETVSTSPRIIPRRCLASASRSTAGLEATL